MTGASGALRSAPASGPIRVRDRSFVIAVGVPLDDRRALEKAIESRGGTIHAYLNAITDVLVVGPVEGKSAEARWAREQIRRGSVYRARWGSLEVVTDDELKAALEVERRG